MARNRIKANDRIHLRRPNGDAVSRAADVDIELAATAIHDARELIGELDQLLAAEYLHERRHGLALEALFQPHIRRNSH